MKRQLAIIGAGMLTLAVGICIIQLLIASICAIQYYYTPNYVYPHWWFTDMDLMGPITLLIGIIGVSLAQICGEDT